MRLDLMTWPEVDTYLSRTNGILISAGSVEQHGPIGLIGTDAICADYIATEAAYAASAIVAPPLVYAPAPFNTGFPGTISISAELFEQLARQIFSGLCAQGFGKIYVVNGHGANLDPLAAAAEACAATVRVRSWWSFECVQQLREKLYGDWEGMHATPSEVAVTQHLKGIVHDGASTPPQKLTPDYIRTHSGDRHGSPAEHKANFPDGRVGSHSGLATPANGKQLFQAATAAVAQDYSIFVQH
ncbi:MAG: creatininase family protein [Hyphomicrobiaceae bacterium]